MLYDLPLEMLDIILQKSYLHWILNSTTTPRDEEVIRSLISVDVCFNRRITRQRFKKAIWRYLKDFYGKTKKRSTMIRNNRNYLVDNIQPSDELIAGLLSLSCITIEKSHLIRHQRSIRDKNEELLYVMESCEETKFTNFIKCLRRTNQKTVAKIIENGGGVIKTRANCAASIKTQLLLLHRKIEDLRDKMKPRSHQSEKFIVELREEGIEILSSELDRQFVVIWIWCRSQEALENCQRLYESNHLRDIFFENIQPSISRVISIDRNQFNRTLVVHQISINFTQRIQIPEDKYGVRGLTKLRNEIYLLCQSLSSGSVIRVFGNQAPFHLQKEIEIRESVSLWDIGSSEKENCLYICDSREECVWKITRETDNEHKIIKWLTTDYPPVTVSVSNDGQLLMINRSSISLMIYGADAELIRSIPLPGVIKYPSHAVETSSGNFVVIHTEEEEEEEEEEQGMEEQEEEDEEVEDEESEEEEAEWKEESDEEEDEEAEDEECEEEEEEWEMEDDDEGEEDEEEEEEVMMEERKCNEWLEGRDRRGALNWRRETMLRISEVNRDGQILICRFIPSNEPGYLGALGYYLSLDSDDRVFVADMGNDRVILLDSDLKWNQILCSTKEEEEDRSIRSPLRLCYDEEMKQLIVGKLLRSQVNVYNLSRN